MTLFQNNFKGLLTPAAILRIGLGLVFIYTALQSLLDPASWVGFLPNWLGPISAPTIAIKIYTLVSLMTGICLLIDFKTKIFSIIAFLQLAAIIVFYGVDNVTFRDFGLATAAIALFLLSSDHHPKNNA